MTPDDFAFLSRLLRRRCGLLLTSDKMALAQRRLEPVIRRFGFRDMDALIRDLRLGCEALAQTVTQAMMVNDTGFFRDRAIFDRFAGQVLPRLLKARAQEKRLRIWSAAAASGQEAYSIAIILSEMGLCRRGWTLDVIATDLSSRAIQQAESGRYGDAQMRPGLDDTQIATYFRRHGTDFVAEESLRRIITFRPFNLLDSYGWLDDLDVIFCRNVLLYFEPEARANVLERMTEVLAADGVLVMGENEIAESLAFQPSPEGPGFYGRGRVSIARVS